MRIAEGLDFDVMLEAKAEDLALLRLRPDLLRYAPDVAARFGILPSAADALEAEERVFLEEVPVEGGRDPLQTTGHGLYPGGDPCTSDRGGPRLRNVVVS
jgi:hypothetical protein